MSTESFQRTLWIDCEFTGLSLDDDLLLEVGAVVTDGLFSEIDSYTAVVSQDIATIALRMSQDDWWPSRPRHQQEILTEVNQSSKTLAVVDKELVNFASQYFDDAIVVAGNSLGIDRRYVARDLPDFNNLLHYRSIDVSSFKEVARRFGIKEYKKINQHRVLADIHESMDELQYLLEKLGISAIHSNILNKKLES